MAKDKAVDSTQLDAALTSVANAIRTKGGTSASLAFPADFVTAIGNIQTGGGGDYVANDWQDPAKPTGAIYSTRTAPLMMKGRTGAFSLDLPNATSIPGDFCMGCTGLTSVNAPNLETTGSWAFASTTAWTGAAYFPKASIMGNCFNGSGISSLVCLRTAKTNSNCCENATNLEAYDQLGSYDIGGVKVFSGCTKLGVIVFRSTSVIALGNINNFTNTKFWSGKAGGTIYIPKYLYDHLGDGTSLDYKAATNWSTINGYGKTTWAQIEGSAYETKYYNGMDCPYRYINWSLTNCTASNVYRRVTMGNAYAATLTADSGYTMDSVTVIMNGVDVTSTVYDSQTGEINIAAIDGTVYITASAV